MSEVIDRLRLASDGFTRSVEVAEAKNAWNSQSPCEEWKVTDVADHVIGNFSRIAGALGEDVHLTGDRAKDWATARETLLSAAGREGALDTMVDGPMGKIPLGQALGVFVTTDTLVHTWDIARAVGADESLDEELSQRAYERALPADEMLRASGMFGPKLDYRDDDPPPVKLLRFFGRPA